MSIPYTYNMVDFSGLDLATINFSVVDGIYNKIVDAIGDWGVAVFYNWFFGEIPIAPQHCQVTVEDGYLMINGIIKVTEDDKIGIDGIVPSPVIEELTVYENGEYYVPDGVDGYNPVIVDVPDPIIINRTFTENGVYRASDDDADGYGVVTVEVAGGPTMPSCNLEGTCHIYEDLGVVVSDSSGARINPMETDRSDFIRPDFSSPFRIHVKFKIISSKANQAIFGASYNGYYYITPSLEVQALTRLWFGVSSNGTSWTNSAAFTSSDITIAAGRTYDFDCHFDGSKITLTVNDGEVEATKTINISEIYSNNYVMDFGSVAYQNRASSAIIYLSNTYIEDSNGEIIWGNKIT